MADSEQHRVIYEQPLNERIRSFLRLEHLFERAASRVEGTDVWASRATMEAVIDIMALIGRADLKTELIKELERHSSTLGALAANPNVDEGRLREFLERIRELLKVLRAAENTPGHELKKNELLGAVRQRNSIPAGTCDFDVPLLHYWLESPPTQRAADLHGWLAAFDILRDSIGLCLQLVRESATGSREVAMGGFFQRTLETATPCQLIRVAVPGNAGWYPEISAGRHRFTIRFMTQSSVDARPVQTDRDVEFQLLCCVL